MNIDKMKLVHRPCVPLEVKIGVKLFCQHRGRKVSVTRFSATPIGKFARIAKIDE